MLDMDIINAALVRQNSSADAATRRAANEANAQKTELNQEDFLMATIGDENYIKPCKALFICDTPLATTKGMDGLLTSNAKKAQELLKEAGYDGTPVLLGNDFSADLVSSNGQFTGRSLLGTVLATFRSLTPGEGLRFHRPPAAPTHGDGSERRTPAAASRGR